MNHSSKSSHENKNIQSVAVKSTQNEPTEDHYAHYDLIMSIEDQERPYQASTWTKVAFFTGAVFFSVFSGLGFGVVGGRSVYKEEMDDLAEEQFNHKRRRNGKKVVVYEDPVLLATRALGWGTLFAILGSGAVGLAVYGLFLKERIRSSSTNSTS